MPSHRAIGNRGEEIAVSFLEQQGMVVLERNFTYHHGEIDIVARDGSELVFVEVKVRRSTRFGLPEEAVTPVKQALDSSYRRGIHPGEKLERYFVPL